MWSAFKLFQFVSLLKYQRELISLNVCLKAYKLEECQTNLPKTSLDSTLSLKFLNVIYFILFIYSTTNNAFTLYYMLLDSEIIHLRFIKISYPLNVLLVQLEIGH